MIVRRCVIVTVLAALALTVSCSPSGDGKSSGPPRAPQGLTLGMVPEGVRLSWDAVPGAKMYSVFWGDNDYSYSGFFPSKTNSFTLGGLKKGELYCFAVTAWNGGGESDYSKSRSLVYDDDPARAPHYLSVADRLIRKGRYQDAQAYLTAAIRLDPRNPVAYQRRAELYHRTNQTERAQQDMSRAETIMKDKPLSQVPDETPESRVALK